MIHQQAEGVTQASSAIEEMIGNIQSVNTSVDKMAESFSQLEKQAQSGQAKQAAVNEKIGHTAEDSYPFEIVRWLSERTPIEKVYYTFEEASASAEAVSYGKYWNGYGIGKNGEYDKIFKSGKVFHYN